MRSRPRARPIWMIFGRLRSCLVIHSPTSGAPATMVAWGGEAVGAPRRSEKGVVPADEDVLGIGQEAEKPRRVADGRDVAVLARAGAGGKGGIDDRPVAGAAAEVPGDPVVDLL